jgi:hypothetical protein
MKQKIATLFFVFTFLSPLLSEARLELMASDLLLKNSEQFNAIVLKKIKKAQDIQAQQEQDVDAQGELFAEPEAVSSLRDAMRIVLSRPDQDGARSKTFNKVRQELNDLHSLESVLKDIVTEAINSLKSNNTNLKYEETYLVILENVLGEMKPEVSSSPTFKLLVEKIRDADIKISDKMKSLSRNIAVNSNPSKTAESIVPKPKK